MMSIRMPKNKTLTTNDPWAHSFGFALFANRLYATSIMANIFYGIKCLPDTMQITRDRVITHICPDTSLSVVYSKCRLCIPTIYGYEILYDMQICKWNTVICLLANHLYIPSGRLCMLSHNPITVEHLMYFTNETYWWALCKRRNSYRGCVEFTS